MNEKLGEAYHHQGFSTTGYMLPLVRGMLGLEVDGVKKTISFTPHLPPEFYFVPGFSMKNVQLDDDTVGLDFTYGDHFIDLDIATSGADSINIIYSPSHPSGGEMLHTMGVHEVEGSRSSAKPNSLYLRTHEDSHLTAEFKVKNRMYISAGYRGVGDNILIPEIHAPALQTESGAKNRSLKIISQELDGSKLRIMAEGLTGETYILGFSVPSKFVAIEGGKIVDIRYDSHRNPVPTMIDGKKVLEEGRLIDQVLVIAFDKKPKPEFVRKEIVITLK